MLIEFERTDKTTLIMDGREIAAIERWAPSTTRIYLRQGADFEVIAKVAEVREKWEAALPKKLKSSRVILDGDGLIQGWFDRDGEFHYALTAISQHRRYLARMLKLLNENRISQADFRRAVSTAGPRHARRRDDGNRPHHLD